MSYSFKISLISLKSKVIITPYLKKYATFLLYTGLNFLGGLCNSEPDGKGIATLSIVSSKVLSPEEGAPTHMLVHLVIV